MPEVDEQTETADAPWTADLAEAFEDETTRATVDGFLREKVQPYVTDLEQRSQVPAVAAKLYEDLSSDSPDETFFQVAEELFGEDVADRLFEAYSGESDENPDEIVEEAKAEQDEPELPEDVRRATEFYVAQQEEQAYEDAVTAARESHADLFPEQLDDEAVGRLLGPFVATADGDMDQALEAYTEWSALLAAGQVSPEDAAAAAAEGLDPDQVPDLPAPVEGGTNPATPVQREYGSIGDAVDDFAAELRAKNAPPPVGGV